MKLPQANFENTVVQNLHGETLIYNLTTNQAFCLNDTAAKVFESCDGATDFARLKEKHQLTDEIIYLALDELKKNNLLTGDYVSPFAGMSRREVVRKVGLASMIALPLILSMVAPTAANASSRDCAPLCIPIGGDICADCLFPVRIRAYPADSDCMGTARGSNPNFICTGPTTNNLNFDLQRN